VFRFGAHRFQLENYKAAKTEMIEQQIEEEFPVTDRQPVLPADEGEPGAELG
jgi:hypothetical protein